MAESNEISAAEVALHSSKEDCWVSIHGKVYDVTTFLEDHPGGEDVILHASAAGDATQSFEDVGHSSTAESMMRNYEIGVLEGFTGAKDSGAQAVRRERIPRASTMQENAYSVMDYVVPILILVVAFGAWYYLTYINID